MRFQLNKAQKYEIQWRYTIDSKGSDNDVIFRQRDSPRHPALNRCSAEINKLRISRPPRTLPWNCLAIAEKTTGNRRRFIVAEWSEPMGKGPFRRGNNRRSTVYPPIDRPPDPHPTLKILSTSNPSRLTQERRGAEWPAAVPLRITTWGYADQRLIVILSHPQKYSVVAAANKRPQFPQTP